MDDYWENIATAIQSIERSDAIVVGIGAGMSASGVSYIDHNLRCDSRFVEKPH